MPCIFVEDTSHIVSRVRSEADAMRAARHQSGPELVPEDRDRLVDSLATSFAKVFDRLPANPAFKACDPEAFKKFRAGSRGRLAQDIDEALRTPATPAPADQSNAIVVHLFVVPTDGQAI